MRVTRKRCPRCEARGQDRACDNLAVYPDGHEFCYGCGYYKPATALQKVKNGQRDSGMGTTVITPNSFSDTLPPIALAWLYKYGISPKEIKEHRFMWNQNKETLVLPYYDGEVMVGADERYFGTGPYPKYLTSGNKKHLKFFNSAGGKPLVLTEDYISALKCGRQFRSCALRSAHINTATLLALLPQHPVPLLFWLDRDKAKESVKFAAKARQFLTYTGSIITDLDPKEYNDEEINEFVSNAIKGIVEA